MNRLLKQLRHVGYVVEDLNASVDMFTKLFDLDGADVRYVTPDETGGQVAFAFISLGGIELEIIQPLTDGFRNGPGIQLFQSRMRTDASASPFFVALAQDGFEWLDKQLAGRETIVPGRFSLADVALFAIAEFGKSVGQAIDPALKNVSAWYDRVAERASAQA